MRKILVLRRPSRGPSRSLSESCPNSYLDCSGGTGPFTRCAAQNGSCRQKTWRLAEKLPNLKPCLAPSRNRLLREKRLTWPLRGAAYHQLSRWRGAMLPSDANVLKMIIPSSVSNEHRLSMRVEVLGECSNTSNADRRLKWPRLLKSCRSSANGSNDVDVHCFCLSNLLRRWFPPPKSRCVIESLYIPNSLSSSSALFLGRMSV